MITKSKCELKKRLDKSQPPREAKFAIICVEPVFYFEIHYPALHFPHLITNGSEKLRMYLGNKGETPTDEELSGFDCVIIPGSSGSAYSQEGWVLALIELIKNIFHNYKKIKIIGGCFGA